MLIAFLTIALPQREKKHWRNNLVYSGNLGIVLLQSFVSIYKYKVVLLHMQAR